MSEQTIWDAGYRAGVKGKSVDDCPYPSTSWRRRPWREGFRIATEPMTATGSKEPRP